MRIHGRSGVAYLAVKNTDQASPMAFLTNWSVDYTQTMFDTTTIVDSQLVHTAGLPDVSGSFSGYYDTATAQTYTAATDGLPRTMYLYPVASDSSKFFTGPVLPDYSIAGGAGAAVSLTVKWAATGRFTRTTSGGSTSRFTGLLALASVN